MKAYLLSKVLFKAAVFIGPPPLFCFSSLSYHAFVSPILSLYCACATHYSKAVVVVRYVFLRPECSLSIVMSVLYTASEETGSSLHLVGVSMWLLQASGCGY